MSFEGKAGGWELWLLDKGKGRQISFEWVTRKQNKCPLQGWREAGKVSFEGTAGGWDLWLPDKGKGELGKGRQISLERVKKEAK